MSVNVTITSLSVTAGFGQNFLKFDYDDETLKGPSYLKLDAIEIHAASTNDRSLATLVVASKVGETEAIHVNTSGAAQYYWARPRGNNEEFGDWYPSSSTGGVAAPQTADIGVTSGYIIFPSGLVMQWGSTTADSNGDATIIFPVPEFFPHQWVGTPAGGTNIDDVYSIKHHTTTFIGDQTQLSVKAKKVTMSGGVAVIQNAASLPIHWIAFGELN